MRLAPNQLLDATIDFPQVNDNGHIIIVYTSVKYSHLGLV